MKEIELKPCPFCGGEAKMHKLREFASLYTVNCTSHWCYATYGGYEHVTAIDAAKKWNTRAETTDSIPNVHDNGDEPHE